MFRRPRAPDGDVVAAARRRLAALAVPHDREPIESAGDTGDDGVRSERAAGASMLDGATTPRHVGPRRGELGRWGVTGHHVTVVALCLMMLLVIVAWWALRSVPESQQVTLSSHQAVPTAGGAEPSTAGGTAGGVISSADNAPTAAAMTPSQLVVDVAGRVRQPGIVELPPGARVVDAITAAGGARPGVSLMSLNLARLLVDGEQVVVGVRVPMSGPSGPSGGSGGGTSTPEIAPVPLNTATLEQLDTLPGIGPVTAQAILQWRVDNGQFTAVDELLEVSGIGDATLDDVRPYVYV